MMSDFAKLIQTLSVVVGVVISVWSFTATQQKETAARELELAKPFLQLRHNLYSEVIKVVAILTNDKSYSEAEVSAAKKRFRQLYVAELSMVETPEVEKKMVALAAKIDPELNKLTPAQGAAYQLSHALRDSFVKDWRVDR